MSDNKCGGHGDVRNLFSHSWSLFQPWVHIVFLWLVRVWTVRRLWEDTVCHHKNMFGTSMIRKVLYCYCRKKKSHDVLHHFVFEVSYSFQRVCENRLSCFAFHVCMFQVLFHSNWINSSFPVPGTSKTSVGTVCWEMVQTWKHAECEQWCNWLKTIQGLPYRCEQRTVGDESNKLYRIWGVEIQNKRRCWE